MKKSLLFLLLCCSIQLLAQKGNTWEQLFNGRDLKGWKPLNGKALFKVLNGEIIGTTVMGEPNSFLVTEKEYGDFILELEFKLDAEMNSGIQFRSLSKADYQNGRVHGYQFEIDPSARAWTGGIYDEARRDWLYPLDYNPAAKKAYKKNEWNKCRIECIGNTIRTFVNGIATAHLVDDVTSKGFIALQVHSINKPEDAGKQIRWRNIRIQTTNLKPTPLDDLLVINLIPNTLSEQEKKNGVKLLFDGISTKGWRGAQKDKFPEKGWEIKDGIMRVLPAAGGESVNGGDIVTEQLFSAFIFQFEFKLTEGANSGVKYFVTENEKNTGSAIGLEYQILDDEKHPDAKMGSINNRTLASLYDLIPSVREPRARRKIGEWNTGMIIVRPDGYVTHYLNGWKMLEYQRGAQYYYALVAKSKYVQWKDFGMAREGRLLLQDHGNEVWFRSLKVQEVRSEK